MQTQLKTLQAEQAKEKSANKTGAATEELQYLMKYSTRQCVAKAKEHPSDFTFVPMANIMLYRGDLYFAHVNSGLKQDTGSITSGSSEPTYIVSGLCVKES